MDESLLSQPIKIPRPQVYTEEELQSKRTEAKPKVEAAPKSDPEPSISNNNVKPMPKNSAVVTVDGSAQTEEKPNLVSVYKTKPTLGIAIEGGANTRQPLPRIINVQRLKILKCKEKLGIAIMGGADYSDDPLPRVIDIKPGGSAHESGGLKVGHVILEVNGKTLKGLEHREAARVIAEAFKDKSTKTMDVLVAESTSKLAVVK